MLTTNMVGGTKCEIHESMPMCNAVCVLCRQIGRCILFNRNSPQCKVICNDVSGA